MVLQRDLSALRESQATETAARPGVGSTSFQLLRREELSELELATLHAFARIHFNADGRPLTHHVQEWNDVHEASFDERLGVASTALGPTDGTGAALRVPQGRFDDGGSEFRFDVNPFQRPPRPWVNLIAKPISAPSFRRPAAATPGREQPANQLTPWSNDPVADPPGDGPLLQDLKTREAWSVAPSAWRDSSANYRIAHGQGYTRSRIGVAISTSVPAGASTRHQHQADSHPHRQPRPAQTAAAS